MQILRNMSEHARTNLRTQLHKVAAVMAGQSGDVTIKEASYLIGVDFWQTWLEKRAMLDGLMSVKQLELDL